MSRRVAAMLVALTALGGCTFDLDLIPASIVRRPLAQSSSAEARMAAELQQQKEDIADARKARDRYLKDGNREDLEEAIRLTPKDPELSALALASAARDTRAGEALVAREVLLRNVAARRKERGLPDSPAETRKEASREMLDAEARILAGGLSGAFTRESALGPGFFFDAYCKLLANYNATFPGDGWTTVHHLDFGFPCK